MKRTLTNIIALVFFGFLIIGAIGVFQNIVQDLQKTFSYHNSQEHILAYQRN